MANSPVRGAQPVRSHPHRRPLHHEFTRPDEMKALSVCLLITLCCVCVAPAQTGSAQNTNNIQALAKQFQTLYQAGSYQQAIPIARQLLKMCEAVLGPEHPDTAMSLNNLAELYRAMGDYAKAEPLYQRASKSYEKAFGPDHPNTAACLNNLGLFYQAVGNYAKAEPLFQRALSIREKALGPEHTDIAASLNNLAAL